MSAATVTLGHVPVGDGHPTVLMAEIGTFFNQDIGVAKEYLRQAIEAGAPVFKTEILHDADICLRATGLLHEYRHAAGSAVEDYRSLIERKTVPLEHYAELLRLCGDAGVPFVASVYDLKGIDFLRDQGAAAVKIARNNIDNVPLIRHAARTSLPIILDAGTVYMAEVARAIQLARSEGSSGIIVNHHPGVNPAPADVHNLRMIDVYKRAFGTPVGLACHYRGEEILYVAVGMGANLLEKGVDVDPDRVEQDLVSAARFAELPSIVAKVRACWEAIGKAPVAPKEPRDLTTRAGFYARASIAAGETLDEEKLAFAFPPLGISVEHADLVFGSSAARNIAAGEIIRWPDVLLRR